MGILDDCWNCGNCPAWDDPETTTDQSNTTSQTCPVCGKDWLFAGTRCTLCNYRQQYSYGDMEFEDLPCPKVWKKLVGKKVILFWENPEEAKI